MNKDAHVQRMVAVVLWTIVLVVLALVALAMVVLYEAVV